MNNYHTHTHRCQHAVGLDRDYVEKAVEEGFHVFGFSDHTPWPYKGFKSRIRMDAVEMDDYASSLNTLKKEFKDNVAIKVGLECEAFKDYYSWLDELMDRYDLDYLILGNHFIGNEENGLYAGKAIEKENLYAYLEESIEAMASGRFAYFCHPDIIFSSYKEFDSSCKDISKKICELANGYGFPLEYNMQGLLKKASGSFKGLGYPCDEFWNIVKQEGCTVIVGLDSYDSKTISKDAMGKTLSMLKAEGFKLQGSMM